jgi:quercetin dioxygenase-like cupin family protein
MTAVAAERAKDGYLLGKAEGEAYWLLGMLEVVKISGADTNGAYGLIEVTVRAGEGSPWHVHPDEDEWFYVLEGEFTVYVGERRLSLAPGSFAFGPKGVPHNIHRRDRRREGTDRLPALPLRGLPARDR